MTIQLVSEEETARVQQVSWQVSADLFSQTTSLGQLTKQSPGGLLNSRWMSIAGKLPSTLFGGASFFPPLDIQSPVLPVTLCCAAVHRREVVLGMSWPTWPCRLLCKLPPMTTSWLTRIPPVFTIAWFPINNIHKMKSTFWVLSHVLSKKNKKQC